MVEQDEYRQGAYQRKDFVRSLVDAHVPSRLHAKDVSLYDFDEAGVFAANSFMGWADLASNPPYPLDAIQDFAQSQLDAGLRHVVLIGQGGSTQAPMTIAAFSDRDSLPVEFTVLDAVYPSLVHQVCEETPLEETMYIVSSKSGTTIEPRFVLQAVRAELEKKASPEEVSKRLVAITDPGSELERQAQKEGWLAVFNGEPTVGGRFSALSVFGLLPAALMGVRIERLLSSVCAMEARCARDEEDNPAVRLAAFLLENYLRGRDMCTVLLPEEGRTLGLWIEQLVAESLGKKGKGIVPLTETDASLLAEAAESRCLVRYSLEGKVGARSLGTKTEGVVSDCEAQAESSEAGCRAACSSNGGSHETCCQEDCGIGVFSSEEIPPVPCFCATVSSIEDLAAQFLLWEYAVACCGYAMRVYPFDQPDVASAKARVLDLLHGRGPHEPLKEGISLEGVSGSVAMGVSPCLDVGETLRDALVALFSSAKPGDYVSLNVFAPDFDFERRLILERMRRSVSVSLSLPTCLEMGSRYLHSTGQLHKGGPNKGLFLIVSADEREEEDIPLPSEAQSLGILSKTQAMADFSILSQRGRRCVHVRLPLHEPCYLAAFEAELMRVLERNEAKPL